MADEEKTTSAAEGAFAGPLRRQHDRRRRVWGLALVVAPFLFIATVLVGTLLKMRSDATLTIPLAIVLLIGSAAFLAVCGAVLHFISEWRLTLGRLTQYTKAAAAGELPIEELSSIDGAWAGLVGEIQDLLRGIRRQKAESAAAEQEIRQRIAQRTNAMERLIGSLRNQANRDALTGLYNRRMFDTHLETFVEQCKSTGRGLCLMMMDLDHFKMLNDTLGHGAGDELLRAVGQIIRSTIRDQDLGFRFGGDEFVIVLPDADLQSGGVMGKRLISLVDALGRTFRVSPSVGLSIGMASLTEQPGMTETALKELADKRLYALKIGRKKIRIEESKEKAGAKAA